MAVCETIANLTNLQAGIKWPNDILVEGKKVCGILIEQRTTGHGEFPLATAVGIGLNLTQPADALIAMGLPDAASLYGLSGIALDHEAAAKELIRQLDDDYDRLLTADRQNLEARWKERLGLLGKFVAVEGLQQHQRGWVLDLSLEGVTIEIDSGEVVCLACETIRHITWIAHEAEKRSENGS